MFAIFRMVILKIYSRYIYFQINMDNLLLYLGNTALDWAVKKDNTEVAEVLREYGKNSIDINQVRL